MSRRSRRWGGVAPTLALALAAAALGPQVASAATTTVGSPLTATYSVVGSGGQITTISNGGPSRVSTVDGTVISWGFVGEGSYTPRVLRPVGDGTYVGAGAGAAMLGSPVGVSGPFATSLAIRKGEQFGADVSANGMVGRAAAPGSIRQTWSPALSLSGEARAPSQSIPEFELAVGAVVRYCLVPKVKGKSPKKAKKRLRKADCTVGKTRKSKKTRNSKEIVKQSVKPGTSISDTEPIDLKVSRTP